MVRMDGEKMSKSLGNLVFVDAAPPGPATPGPSAWPSSSTTTADSWEWDDDLMPRAGGAARALAGRRRRRRASAGKALDEVRAALDDDLDTPRAVAAIDAAVDRGEAIADAAALLGVDLRRRPGRLSRPRRRAIDRRSQKRTSGDLCARERASERTTSPP